MRLEKILLVILACFLVSSPVWSEDIKGNEYEKIADRIIDKVVSLKNDYPHFIDADNESNKEESLSGEGLYIKFEYEHGVTWIDNPNYIPNAMRPEQIKSFSKADSIGVLLIFTEGDWTVPDQEKGQQQSAIISPKDITSIGKMRVVMVVNGAKTEETESISQRIQSFINQENEEIEKVNPGAENENQY